VLLELDQPIEEAALACGSAGQLKLGPERSIALEKAEAQTKAAESSYRRAKSNLAPDLELGLSVGANGIAPQRSDALKEFGQVAHPLVSVQVGLSFPIGLHSEKAELQAASAEWIRAEASLVQAQDEQKLGWVQACEQFFVKYRAYDRLVQAFRNQNERVSLEEKRFEGGRTALFSMIQSGGDALDAELSLRASEVYRRIAAWKVLRRQGKILEKLAVIRSAAATAQPIQ
jgi:outer membrane protein TolC